jgi:hypothetical protein
MAVALTRPVQVFLDTRQLIQVQPAGTRGPQRDFFAGNNAGSRVIRRKCKHSCRKLAQVFAPTEIRQGSLWFR